MEFKDFEFPEVEPDLMVDTNPELLEMAKAKGFFYGRTKYNQMFSDIYYRNREHQVKLSLGVEFTTRAINYFNALKRSWLPAHEDKEAVCALILSELVE